MDILKKIKINDIEYDITPYNNNTFRQLTIESFGDSLSNPVKRECFLSANNVDGFYVELKSNTDNSYFIEVCDENKNIVFSTDLKNNMYSKLNRKFYTKWTTNVYTEDKSTKLISEEFDLTNSRVFIVFESSSLGDTLAWMPYCEEFAKKHNCKVLVSTFKNEMFEGMYSDIEFVRPGSVVQNIKALYRLGWFYDKDKEPVLPNTIPLQKTATNILGLDFTEIRPRLAFVPKERPINEKYVTIGMSTTAGCKEWTYPNGWQKLINYLNSMGYKVAVIQKESFSGIDNVLDWTGDKPLVERMNQIHHSEFYIGLGSGLSWLAWAVNKHVVMISNFSEDGHEFTDNTTRIINKSVCNGCWNNPMFMFDKGDWNWCPEHKGTERQFECHKSISSDMVIEKIQHLIK